VDHPEPPHLAALVPLAILHDREGLQRAGFALELAPAQKVGGLPKKSRGAVMRSEGRPSAPLRRRAMPCRAFHSYHAGDAEASLARIHPEGRGVR
jgi:hypothetical protein